MGLKQILLIVAVCLSTGSYAQKKYEVLSPSSKIKIEVEAGTDIRYRILSGETVLMDFSPVSMTIQDGKVLGKNPKINSVKRKSVDDEIESPLYKKAKVNDHYNEICLNFKGNYGLVFRAYDDGAAYRFVTTLSKPIEIYAEEATLNFPKNYYVYASDANRGGDTFESQYFNSFENTYNYKRVTEMNEKKLKYLPLMVEADNGIKVVVTESDLEDYPGLFYYNDTSKPTLYSHFAPYPKVIEQGGHHQLQGIVKEREPYMAKTAGNRAFPWRVFVISEKDFNLVNNDMVYRLAAPNRLNDISWIKPGKVAWEWWNDLNISGVDFRSGVNQETYKYYIDFASKKGIEYIILDEGWSVFGKGDLLAVIPEIDLPELVAYGKERNVGIILWAGYWAYRKDMEKVTKHYSDMGIKGFKIDFLDRDDQDVVAFTYEAARICAKYHMLADLHGVYKPTGLQRTYPNVINYEGVNGLEQLKCQPSDYDQVTYDLQLPYIRQIAGPMDYTQGAMRNVSKGNYRPIWDNPVSQGTRCRQLALYVIFESPLTMLCDNPSAYLKEDICTSFISSIPTVWVETVPLAGEISKSVAVARKAVDGSWYVGALTNWDPREMELDLSFLGEGEYEMAIIQDGVNSDRNPEDFKCLTLPVPDNRKCVVRMMNGGGYVAKITKK